MLSVSIEQGDRHVNNVLAHCKQVDQAYMENGDVPTRLHASWNRNLGWIDALEMVTRDYHCLPKDKI